MSNLQHKNNKSVARTRFKHKHSIIIIKCAYNNNVEIISTGSALSWYIHILKQDTKLHLQSVTNIDIIYNN